MSLHGSLYRQPAVSRSRPAVRPSDPIETGDRTPASAGPGDHNVIAVFGDFVSPRYRADRGSVTGALTAIDMEDLAGNEGR
jgi:hypothetical protein